MDTWWNFGHELKEKEDPSDWAYFECGMGVTYPYLTCYGGLAGGTSLAHCPNPVSPCARVCTSSRTSGGSSTLQSKGQNQQWPISGRIDCITPAVCTFPNASRRGTKSGVAHKWTAWLHNPDHLGGPQHFIEGNKISGRP